MSGYYNDDTDDDDNDNCEETRICYRCGQRGHIVRDCHESPQQKQCYCCKGFGHIVRNCPANFLHGKPNGTRQPQMSQGNNSQSNFHIENRKGYLTNQNVDVIVVCSSSDRLTESVLQAVGPKLQKAYKERTRLATDFANFAFKCSNLPFKEIFFLQWTPCNQIVLTEQAINNFITTAIAYVLSRNYRSVAFPSIGCGQFGLDPNFIAQTMINHVKIEQYPLNVAFIIHPQSHNVFNAFQNAMASTTIIHRTNTVEYNTTVNEFDKTMLGRYNKINRIERIQNERWYKQYLVHRDDFKKRLGRNTEKFLYHGCSNITADSIIEEYFNGSFTGKNGTVYGNGVYFSSRAAYSHSYAVPNNRGERCMFFARVLIGCAILGDNTMKVCPRNYHTTTDGEHIYVTYHDTQAYGQYLIRYQ